MKTETKAKHVNIFTWVTAFMLTLGVLVYLKWPLDLLPDTLPWVGYVDDAIIFVAGIWIYLRMSSQRKVNQFFKKL